jgi:hypothetical protein
MGYKMSDFMNNEIKIKCQACGDENKAVNTFCMNCGERLLPGETAGQAPQAQAEMAAGTQSAYDNPAGNFERADAEVVSSTPWQGEGNQDHTANPYQNTGAAYTAPTQYANTGNVKKGGSGLAIASLVCGIVSFACCYFSFFVSIAGLVTGIIALVKKHNGRGMAIAGIIISSLSILFYVILILAVVFFAFNPSFGTGYNFYDFY